MTPRELEMIRPWLDPERRPIDVRAHPPGVLVRKGYVRFVVDRFYELTERGQREVEKLTGRAL